jgi:hemolysin activation/secretion protein
MMLNQNSNHHYFRTASLFLSIMMMMLCARTSMAATLTPTQIQQINQATDIARKRAPDYVPGSSPKFDFRIQAPEKAAQPKAIDDIEFDVAGVAFDGATVFTKSEMESLFAPMFGTKVGLSALRDAAAKLEAYYRQKGYFLVRVFIPPQQVKDGIFKIKVVEGYVNEVFVQGPDDEMNERVQSFVMQLSEVKPISLSSLERVLLLLNDLPGVSGTAVLRQGAEVGASDILVTVNPLPTSQSITVGNENSKTVGPASINYNLNVTKPLDLPGFWNLNLTQAGDLVYSELYAVSTRYSQAYGNDGAVWSVGLTASQAYPGYYLAYLNIVSTSTAINPKLHYPLIRSRESSVYIDTGLSFNRSQTDIKYTLSTTAVRTNVAEFTPSWNLDGWMDGTQSLSFSTFKGFQGFGSNLASDALAFSTPFNPDFLKFTYSFTRTQQLPLNFSIQLNISGQFSRDKLPSAEQASYGGQSSGRGYDSGAITGDRGTGALIELRRDTEIAWAPYIGNMQLYTSFDASAANSIAYDSTAGARAYLSSWAVGSRFPLFGMSADFQVGGSMINLHGTAPKHNPHLNFTLTTSF